MPEKRLKVAIVGCGVISGAHIKAFGRHRDRAQIVFCCDTDREKAQKAVEAVNGIFGEGATQAVSDYAALLAHPEVDAVDLCLPHHLHASFAIDAARAGKHILCEKPLALTPEECDRMILAAQEAGVILMHGENWRTAELAERAAEVIGAGRLGTLVGLQATYAHWQWDQMNTDWRARPAESGGGHLMDGGIHIIDVLRHLGGEITAVHAMTAQFRPELGPQSEDTAVLNFRYAGGHLGQLFACHAARGRGASPILTVFGTEGCLSLEAGPGRALLLFLPGQQPEVLAEHHSWQDTFEREIVHFLDVVQNGAPLRSRPEDGRANVRIVLAAYESARSGREIELDKVTR